MDDRPKSRTLTRDELYQAIWSTPMRTLAKGYGISDVALAKICKRLEVPHPGLGYWSRVQHGQKATRIRLPPRKESTPASVEIRPFAHRQAPLAPGEPPRPPPPDIAVSTTLKGAHAAVRALARALRVERGYERMLSLAGEGETVMRVASASRARALLLLDALFKGLKARGHDVVVSSEGDPQPPTYSLFVVVNDFGCPLTLMERTSHPGGAHRKGQPARRASDYVPTGRLTLTVGSEYGEGRRSWADGRSRRLEAILGEIVVGIEAAAELEAAEHRRRDDERQRRERQEAARVHDQLLVKDLLAMAGAWVQARQLATFVEAAETVIPVAMKNDAVIAWLAWARRYAGALDPLTHPERIAKVLEPPPSRP
jgi:hypothetical protein